MIINSSGQFKDTSGWTLLWENTDETLSTFEPQTIELDLRAYKAIYVTAIISKEHNAIFSRIIPNKKTDLYYALDETKRVDDGDTIVVAVARLFRIVDNGVEFGNGSRRRETYDRIYMDEQISSVAIPIMIFGI